jgi:hypothetical protein
MAINLSPASALGPEIEGSIGSFKVASKENSQKTLEVKYFLTHIGINFSSGNSSGMLSYLAPVRELFDPGTLEFDEIMQRDLDDARVSSELIPYLLDPGTKDLVKLFPPIIVVVLPTEGNENRPANKYPEVRRPSDEFDQNVNCNIRKIVSGLPGQEVFQLSQPVTDQGVLNHDLARLRINPNRTKLVIVDGQHRAMALLALYRNLKQEWSDARRKPYQSYYEEWSPEYINSFQLDQLSMPVMFCVFPELDEKYTGDYDLKKASRAIFLALNKNAKKVSESRNKLLDDNDLVALFLRKTLSHIKSKDSRSDYPLQIFNVELDQSHDKMKIDSPIAITGVNHVYYMIEHVLLNKLGQDVKGIRQRTGKFWMRKDLEDSNAMTRLDGRNKLGSSEADDTKRDSFTSASGEILSSQFHERFGWMITAILDRLSPFKIHCDSTLWLELNLKSSNPPNYSILFDGQGIFNVFNAHRENLQSKSKNNMFGSDPSRINAIIEQLDTQAKSLQRSIRELSDNRANRFTKKIRNRSELVDEQGALSPRIVKFIDDLYSNVFSTVAFQSALFITFIEIFEKTFGVHCWNSNENLRREEFENYLSSLSRFFLPETVAELKRLAEIFAGHVDGAPFDWNLAKTNYTFRSVVHADEMQPDQWPKYKYLILEIWNPSSEELSNGHSEELEHCRSQVFQAFTEKKKKEWLLENQKLEEAMSKNDRQEVNKVATNLYKKLLANLGKNEFKNEYFEALRLGPLVEGDADDSNEDQIWGSEAS